MSYNNLKGYGFKAMAEKQGNYILRRLRKNAKNMTENPIE